MAQRKQKRRRKLTIKQPDIIIPIMFSPAALDIVFWALSKQDKATVAPIIAGMTAQINMFNILNKEKAEAGQAA